MVPEPDIFNGYLIFGYILGTGGFLGGEVLLLNSIQGKGFSGKPDIILVANGSEVSTLVDSAERLMKEKGLKVQVVSAPSEGLFRKQDKVYQDKVLPPDTPALGLTAGLPVTLRGLVGPKGKVKGVEHFGYSAPYKVLDEKFGFTAENVYNKVIEFLA